MARRVSLAKTAIRCRSHAAPRVRAASWSPNASGIPGCVRPWMVGNWRGRQPCAAAPAVLARRLVGEHERDGGYAITAVWHW